MKKTVTATCAAIIGVMLVLPWLTAIPIRADTAWILCLLLFFCVDPLCAIFTGVTAGKHLRKLWWIPLLTAAAFPIGVWIRFVSIVTEFLIYAMIYFVLGTAAMFVSAWVHK